PATSRRGRSSARSEQGLRGAAHAGSAAPERDRHARRRFRILPCESSSVLPPGDFKWPPQGLSGRASPSFCPRAARRRTGERSRGAERVGSMAAVSEVPILLGGRWEKSAAARWGEVFNPSRGEVIARVPFCPAAEVDRVVRAAAAALPGWAETSPVERAR